MEPFCTNDRPPRAGLDPIDHPAAAAAFVRAVRTGPDRHETAVVPLDEHYRGRAVIVVSDTDPPDRELDVVEFLVGTDLGATDHLLVVSCRPGGRPEPDDADRWLEMDHLCSDSGLRLLEWFVAGIDTWCPRDLLGVPARWPQPDAPCADGSVRRSGPTPDGAPRRG